MAVNIDSREFKGAAVETTIVGAISAAATTITVAASTGWPTGTPGPFVIVLDHGQSTEEKVLIESRVGSVLNVATGGRGYDGTSAAAHVNGASVAHSLDAAILQQIVDSLVFLEVYGARTDVAPQFWAGINLDGTNGDSKINFRTTVGAMKGWIGIDTGDGYDDGDLLYSVSESNRGHRFLAEAGTEIFRIAGTAISSSKELRVGPGGLDAGVSGAYLTVGGSGTGAATVEAKGGATDVDLELRAKGSGAVILKFGGTERLRFASDGAIRMAGAFSIYDAAGSAKRFDVAADGTTKVNGPGMLVGDGAIDGVGNYVQIGSFGDTLSTYIQALGSNANIALYMSAKGTADVVAGTKRYFRVEDANNGNVGFRVDPTTGTTAGTSLGAELLRGDLALNTGILRFAAASASVSTATAGGVGSLPATVAGYIKILVDGVTRKIPYYAN